MVESYLLDPVGNVGVFEAVQVLQGKKLRIYVQLLTNHLDFLFVILLSLMVVEDHVAGLG